MNVRKTFAILIAAVSATACQTQPRFAAEDVVANPDGTVTIKSRQLYEYVLSTQPEMQAMGAPRPVIPRPAPPPKPTTTSPDGEPKGKVIVIEF